MYGAEQPFRKPRTSSQKSVTCFFHFLLCASCYLWQPNCANSLSADGVALLAIKAGIRSDPLGLLSDWKNDGSDPCTWNGVGCAHSGRVVSLNISSSAWCGGTFVSPEKPKSPCDFFGGVSRQESCVPVCRRRSANSSFGNNSASGKLTGILPSAIGNLSELRILSLPFNSISGVLPKKITALKFLEVLDVRGNAFSGSIPVKIGRLSRLRSLNLAYNSLEGRVPWQLSGCRKLQVLNLAGNMLSGNIPASLGSLPDLQVLALSFNNLVGTIPPEVTRSCSVLEHFHVESNFLTGNIPAGFGNCSQLRSFVVSSNLLSGTIPAGFGQLRMLQSLDVSWNSLGGEIPSQLGNCSELSLLVLTNYLDARSPWRHCAGGPKDGNFTYQKDEYNYFSTLPTAIMKLPKLRILWAPSAALSGDLPSDWGSCQSLEVLNLAGNSITGNVPAGLTKCRSLIYLDLSANRLEGIIPQQLPISCMVVFNVSGNFLSGGLPDWPDMSCPSATLLGPPSPNPVVLLFDDLRFTLGSVQSYFSSLYCGNVARAMPVWSASQGLPIVHDMSANNFTGSLPGLFVGVSFMKKAPAYGLFVSGNRLSGIIPSSLFESCQYFQTLCLSLSNNSFSKSLPAEAMVNCTTLRQFEAASNQLTGKIPSRLGKLSHLVYLDLRKNKLSGELPSQVGQLQELQYLILANNCLRGKIPEAFGKLTSLVLLDLSGNELTGDIPGELANLNQLKELFLNSNYLSGIIPGNFTNLNHLVVMDVAFNNLSGSVPRIGNKESLCTSASVIGNKFLESCSAAAPAPSLQQPNVALPYADPIPASNSHHPNSIIIAAITSGCAIAAVLLILILLFQYTKQKVPVRSGYQSGRKQLVTFRNLGFQLTYDNVIAATGNFSLNNLIGNGGFGATYKAELIPGLLVAIKRLSLGRFQGTQQFDAEIRTLGRIQHPNLVTLIGYHASESQMFLIYNYLPGGNLENLIHDRRRGFVSWRVRYKIALDIAQALAYLHDECMPRVLHRDIKPSNVLLDNNLNAFLSDFGLARLLSASETHATTDVAGTFGYVAPEYAMTCRLSDKADVYSYGVVLLELLSGKRALDPSFSDYGHGFNIVAWACQLFQKGKPTEVFAPGLWEQGPHSELYDVLKLAVKCTVVTLSVRPTMKQVVDVLKSVR